MAAWFYMKDKQQHGPVDEETVAGLLAKGELNGNSFVWNNSFGTEWKKICQVAGFNKPAQAAAPAAAINPVTAYLSQRTEGAQHAPAAEEPKPRSEAMRKISRYAVKLIFFAAVGAAGYFVWQNYFYKSAAASAYETFAQADFELRFEDALKLCARGQAYDSVNNELQAMNALKNPPKSGLAKMLTPKPPSPPEIRSKKYSVLSEKKQADGSVVLKIQQQITVMTEYSPFQATLISNHSATMVKENDSWKVASFSVERLGAINPMNGRPL
ncbi:MAG: hypothetical protein C0404_03000 [Verrucomicrobia bacterium]|nr:hypothetical protein [Verrucomicrobiota bacterium]